MIVAIITKPFRILRGIWRHVLYWRHAKRHLDSQVTIKRSREELEFLPAALEIVETPASPFIRWSAALNSALIVGSDAVEKEGVGLVFPIRAKLSTETLRVGSRTVALAPGMAVTAEIKTGKRRVLDYFLSTISKYQAETLREM